MVFIRENLNMGNKMCGYEVVSISPILEFPHGLSSSRTSGATVGHSVAAQDGDGPANGSNTREFRAALLGVQPWFFAG